MQTFNIKTKRFELRPAMCDNLSDLKSILSNPDIVKMLLGDVSTPRGVEKEARKWIDNDAFWSKHRFGSWGIFDRDGTLEPANSLLGVVAASPSLAGLGDGPEIFYFVNEDYWGRGVAYEAALGMIEYLFEIIGVSLIEASIFAEINPGSVQLAQKLGLTPAGRVALRDHGLDDDRLQELVTFDLWRVRNANQGNFRQILSEAAIRIGQTIAEDFGSVSARQQELLDAVKFNTGSSINVNEQLANMIEEQIVFGMESPGLALYRAHRDGNVD